LLAYPPKISIAQTPFFAGTGLYRPLIQGGEPRWGGRGGGGGKRTVVILLSFGICFFSNFLRCLLSHQTWFIIQVSVDNKETKNRQCLWLPSKDSLLGVYLTSKNDYCRSQSKCLGHVTRLVEETCTSSFLDLLNTGAFHTIIVHQTLFRIFLSKTVCDFSALAFLFSVIESFNNFQYSLQELTCNI